MNLDKYIKLVETVKIKKEILSSEKEEKDLKLDALKEYGTDLETSRDIMVAVSILSQSEFKTVIESLVTQMLQYVFGENYSFLMENKLFRDQSETHMFVVKDGKKRSLRDEQGGGVLDVVSIALRIVFWAIDTACTEPFLVFDEPAKFVSKDKLELVSEILKSISDMLGLQILLVTHEEDLVKAADKCYLVKMVDKVSKVEQII